MGAVAVPAPYGSQTPLQAQEGDGTAGDEPRAGVGIRLSGLSSYPTHTTADQTKVEVTNLSAAVVY